MGTCKRQVHSIDDLQKKPRSSFAVGKGVFAKRTVYKHNHHGNSSIAVPVWAWGDGASLSEERRPPTRPGEGACIPGLALGEILRSGGLGGGAEDPRSCAHGLEGEPALFSSEPKPSRSSIA
jgi:hypothetical protein